MKNLTATQKNNIELSLNLNMIGWALNKMINDRAQDPSLYTGNGSARKWSVQLGVKHINLYKRNTLNF